MTGNTDRVIEEGLYLAHCTLCPRACGVNRMEGKTGRCGETAEIRAGLAWLHQWEEPCLTGKNGSGAVFFSGCSLGCIFCQNYILTRREGDNAGLEGERVPLTEAQLADVFLRLEAKGAANINLVTACHFIPQVSNALTDAKRQGLSIPVVYNSSGYESVSSLKMLEGLVDIWLPDFKYMDPSIAKAYSGAPDYPDAAKAAIREMVRICGGREYNGEGIMTRGVIVRHMLLPGHVSDSKKILKWLHETFGERILISVMNQYTPMPAVRDDPLLSRRVTRREYGRLLEYALEIGIEDGFFQEGKAAEQSFVPRFDGSGLV